MNEVDAELAKLATQSCEFMQRGIRCGKPSTLLEGRSLCPQHLVYVLNQRTKLRRKHMRLDELTDTLHSLSRDIANVHRG